MTTIKEIESAIKELSKTDLFLFRKWFENFDSNVWDKQFDEDASSGKLDGLANKAVSDLKAGQCKEI